MSTTKLSPNVPTRTVALDRPRTMALTLGALKRIRDITGSLDMQLDEDSVFERAPSLVWASLVDGDREDLSPEDVAGMLHAGNLAEVVGALQHLTQASTRAEGNAVPAPSQVKAGKKTTAKRTKRGS